MGDTVILLSGGMDSGVLLAWARSRFSRIVCLYFDYGSRHQEKEYAMAQRLATHFGTSLTRIDLPFMNDLFSSSLLTSGPEIPDGPYADDNISSTVVPFRNGIMLSIAVGYAENHDIGNVLIASHSGDHPIYPDCRASFTDAMSKAATEGTSRGIKIEAPFHAMAKEDIAETGRKMGFDFSMTWSCYKGLSLHCGRCATCLERKTALGYDKGLDPTEYEQ
ncbi:MAG TPA: 7-cyano-7-deazaguanine synthase QueC [Deltaproteobacteria bacterium]|nr:7-cyano-7-deazaguanine synthase QueC [Deltaproteobacteria bacterium]